MSKLVVICMVVITTVSAYGYDARAHPYDNPSPAHLRSHYDGYPSAKRSPVLRSSFGGSSFNGSTSNVELNPVQHGQVNKRKYGVRVGHAFGAHSGEYFNTKSKPWPNQSYRYQNK